MVSETRKQLELRNQPEDGIADALEQVKTQQQLGRAKFQEACKAGRENEELLRNLIGLPADDWLMPSEEPPMERPYKPDWNKSWQKALSNNKKELYLAKWDVVADEVQVRIEKALSGDWVGCMGSDLLGYIHIGGFSRGIVILDPNRVRTPSQLALVRSFENQQNAEQRFERNLCLEYRRIFSTWELIRIQKAQREAFAEQLHATEQQFRTGNCDVAVLLERQRSWVESLVQEQLSTRDYTKALVAFNFLVHGTPCAPDENSVSPLDKPGQVLDNHH